MKAVYPTIKVDDLLAKERGISVGVMYPGKHTDAGIPLIRAGDIKDGVIDPFVSFCVSPEVHHEYRRTALIGGEILITLVGNPGVVAIVPDSMAGWNAARAIAVVRLKNPEDALFFKAAFAAPEVQHTIRNVCNTTVQATLNLKDIRALDLPWPDKATRGRIASLLGAVDRKIELNRRMSATLEDMARALYRSWFVDFDPVHARALGQPPAHMDATTAALFPDSFGPDGLPKGWEMSSIGEVAETVGGATPKTKEPAFWDGPHRWATPRDLSKLGQPVLFETDRTLTDAGLAKISSGLSPAGTVLLSSRAPIGYVAIAQNPVAVNQGFIALRETDRISTVEVYFWVQSNMDAILANANGSTFQEISKKNFRPLTCVVAPAPVRSAFRDLAGTWFDRVAGLCAESANLAALRDTLLPRLMSGELRIHEAEKQVEEFV